MRQEALFFLQTILYPRVLQDMHKYKGILFLSLWASFLLNEYMRKAMMEFEYQNK